MRAGIRQFHFNAWKDPNGTLAANPAGLKLAGITNMTLDPKYSYFGALPLLSWLASAYSLCSLQCIGLEKQAVCGLQPSCMFCPASLSILMSL